MTPSDLATELGIPASRLRRWLRDTWPPPVPGQRWHLTPEQVTAARTQFAAGLPAAAQPRSTRAPARVERPAGGRAASDEAYVLDLLDRALGEPGRRQHRFDWLRGDPNARGQRTRLPVDGYWAAQRLVVEYRERQHDEPTAFFDRRATVSGIGRGEQRRRYDALRDTLIPEHGLTLLIIKPNDLDADRRGRLRRNPEADDANVRKMLAARGLLERRAEPAG